MPDDSDEPRDFNNPIGYTTTREISVPNTLKGRFQKLALKWLAGGIAHPYIREVRDNLDVLEGRSKVNMMLAEEVGRQALSDPLLVERAKARFLGDLYSKQGNVEAVIEKAAEIVDEASGADDLVSDKEVSDDWMNTFIRYAESATSDDLRSRLAKLLAGETRAPGSFSRAAVRTIAEMSERTLHYLLAAQGSRISNWIVSGDDWTGGQHFTIGIHLEAEGLITGSGGTFNTSVSLNQQGEGYLLGEDYGLFLRGSASQKHRIGCWLLTEVGGEVISLLPPRDEASACRKAAILTSKRDLLEIDLIHKKLTPGGAMAYRIEQLWRK